MPRYRYTAIGQNGRSVSGQIEAPTREGVTAALRARGQWAVEIQEAAAQDSFWTRDLLGARGLKEGELALIARELSTLLKAGVPLDRGLGILLDISETAAARRFLTKVQNQVKNGAALSDAVEASGDGVSKGHVGLLRAGEAGGTLPLALAQLADFLERSVQTREVIRSALAYPLLVILVAVGALGFLVTVVLPRFETVFASAGKSMPGPAAVVLGVGNFIGAHWPTMLAAIVALTLFYILWRRTPSGRLSLSQMFLSLPVVGSISQQMDCARFCRTFALMLSSGVQALRAAEHSVEAMNSAALRHRARDFAAHLNSGAPLSEAMARTKVFTKLALNMARVGEESGALPEMLGRAAELYESTAERRSRQAVQMIAPAATIGLGALIAAIIVSMMSAMLSINDLV